MMKKIYGFGIVGIGSVSRYYLDSIERNPRAKIIALCDTLPKNDRVFRQYTFFDNYKKMISLSEIDTVVISTPPISHSEIAIYSLKRGKNVILEKPASLNISKAKECLKIAEQQQRSIYFAYHATLNENVLKFKRYRDSCLRDPIIKFDVVYKEDVCKYHPGTNWVFNPRISGGGCLIDSGINAVSIIEDILGRVKLVYANLQYSPGYRVETSAQVKFISCQNLFEGTFEIDWMSKEKEIRKFHFVHQSGRESEFNLIDETGVFKGDYMRFEYQNIIEDAIFMFDQNRITNKLSYSPLVTILECYKTQKLDYNRTLK
jgi:predicted dehydrogenase